MSRFSDTYYSMRSTLMFLLLFLSNFAARAQGLKINDDAYRKIPIKKSYLTTTDSLPRSVDMSAYVPSVIDQGQLGTCVAVSSAYYARTILEAIRLDITDKKKIDELRFSPSYLYNAIKDSTDLSCMAGTEITAALEFMKKTGVAAYSEQGYPFCGNNQALPPSPDSRILDYIKIFDLTERGDVVTAAKKALSEKTPILVGIQITPSFEELGGWQRFWRKLLVWLGFKSAEDYALWDPSKGDSDLKGGHAVCVVGYDDTKFEGAFKAVNSYGEDWGDQGFFWISYTDFVTYAKYGFQAYAQPANDTDRIQLSADVTINYPPYRADNLVSFEMGSEGNGMVAYSLSQPQPSGTEYKFYADIIDQKGYLYLVAANDAKATASVLFPTPGRSHQDSPFIGANTRLILPAEDIDSIYRLTNETGTEYWLFLFSENPVDIESYVAKMNATQGSFANRALEAFGTELIPYQRVSYKEKKIGFLLKGEHKGHIVPLLISLRHVPKRAG